MWAVRGRHEGREGDCGTLPATAHGAGGGQGEPVDEAKNEAHKLHVQLLHPLYVGLK
jgi:hypothetical protein